MSQESLTQTVCNTPLLKKELSAVACSEQIPFALQCMGIDGSRTDAV